MEFNTEIIVSREVMNIITGFGKEYPHYAKTAVLQEDGNFKLMIPAYVVEMLDFYGDGVEPDAALRMLFELPVRGA